MAVPVGARAAPDPIVGAVLRPEGGQRPPARRSGRVENLSLRQARTIDRGSWPILSRRQDEPLVAIGGDFIALLLVGGDAADIGHEDARLAGNIGAHVPGVRQRIERAVGDLVGVLDPGILGSLLGLDALQPIVAQMRQAAGDPVDMLLAAEDHLALHAGALRARDHEEVREAGDHDAEIGARAARPLLLDRRAPIGADIDLLHGAGHGIEACCEGNRIEVVVGVRRAQAVGCDLLDRCAADVDQRDVVAIVGLVIVGIEDEPLRSDRVIIGAEQLRRPRVLDGGADPLAHEVRSRIVGRLVHQEVVVGIEIADAAALLPFCRIHSPPLVLRRFERRLLGRRIPGDAEGRLVGRTPALGIFGLVLALLLGIEWSVAGGKAEVGGALEDKEVLGLPGDVRDHLHARGARADDADPEAGEIDAFVGP